MVLLQRYQDDIHMTRMVPMRSKILCTTGPGMWTMAITRAIELYRNNLDELHVQIRNPAMGHGLNMK